ncbi:Lar family restriction alleviation protein [Desulfovibrio sp.]
MNNLTCPFCASAACFIDRSMAPGAYYVRCGQCCATGPTFDTEDKAISAWENLLNRLDRKTISLRISPEIVSATSLVEGFGYALQNIVEALDRQARQEGLTPQQKDTIQQIADGLRKPCILEAFTQSECVQRARIKSPQ